MSAPDVSSPLPDLDLIHTELTAVDAALERLESGTYGRCAICGDPLDDEALAADPLTERCGRHLL